MQQQTREPKAGRPECPRHIAVGCSVVGVVLCFWIGEGPFSSSYAGSFAGWILFWIPPFAIALVVAWLASRKALAGALTFLVGLGALKLGTASYQAAAEEALERAGTIQAALEEHERREGEFPEDLYSLEIEIPGERWLHGSALNYRRTSDEDYDLWLHVPSKGLTFRGRRGRGLGGK